jgi:hypothetical protein
MKGKGGPSFFDILRTTMKQELNPSKSDAPPPPPDIKLTPELPSFGKDAPDGEPDIPPPPVARRPLTPAVMEPKRGALESPGPDDPDVRTFSISQTTALFGLLIGLIVLLGAFYAGIRVGRMSSAPETSEKPIIVEAEKETAPETQAPVEVTPTPAPQPRPAAAPPPKWTIKLMEWQARTSFEGEKNKKGADYFKRYLESKGHAQAKVSTPQGKVILYYGAYPDRTAPQALKELDALRSIKYSGRRGTAQIFKGAGFVAYPW